MNAASARSGLQTESKSVSSPAPSFTASTNLSDTVPSSLGFLANANPSQFLLPQSYLKLVQQNPMLARSTNLQHVPSLAGASVGTNGDLGSVGVIKTNFSGLGNVVSKDNRLDPTMSASLHYNPAGLSAVTGVPLSSQSPLLAHNTLIGQALNTGFQLPAFQRLKVEDALTYLDQVKLQFGNQPTVYNDFLDIMKDFKSQAIDTPGVIQRVSRLFRGHPNLIVGFNTFLPHGYRIEMQGDGGEQVTICTPNGQSHVIGADGELRMLAPLSIHNSVLSNGINNVSTTAAPHSTVSNSIGQKCSGLSPNNNNHHHVVASKPNNTNNISTSLSNNATASQQQLQQPPASNQTGGQNSASNPAQPVEFSHAITYVNKIKSRFASQPDIYKHFLEILHTYQKEQKLKGSSSLPVGHVPLSEAEVYKEVAKLFKNEHDLLDEFSQFLPDAAAASCLSVTVTSAAATLTAVANNLGAYSTPSKVQPAAGLRKPQAVFAVSNSGSRTSGVQCHTIAQFQENHAVPVLNNSSSSAAAANSAFNNLSNVVANHQHHNTNAEEGPNYPIGAPGTPQISNNATTACAVLKTVVETATVTGNESTTSSPTESSLSSTSSPSETAFATAAPDTSCPATSKRKEPSAKNGTGKAPPSGGTRKRGGSPASASTTTVVDGNNGATTSARDISTLQGQANLSTAKKPKLSNNNLAVSSNKHGTLADFEFFDRVRKCLRSQEVYDNFLRCVDLFNKELVSRSELLQITQPFLCKFPELQKWLKDFLACNEASGYVEPIPQAMVGCERISSDLALEIDYATCKKYGASYRALPKTYQHPQCSGRTALCNEVLNDVWVSFPSWSSEDSSFVSSKKTQYEEFIYRTEDERFELDIVIETNLATIHVLEALQKKISNMTPEELGRLRIDDNLGGRSQVLHQRAIRRIYGDKAEDIIEGLKRNPAIAVPLVLRRLKAKDEEWREAQKSFNKIWREQNEKFYLKSLDHQGLNFKQNDLKQLRSKSLLNQIETLYDERHEQNEDGLTDPLTGPHMMITYPADKQVFQDATDLLIHHVKRQTGMQQEEKQHIKRLLKHTIPDLFNIERANLSDVEDNDEENESTNNSRTPSPSNTDGKSKSNGSQKGKKRKKKQKDEAKPERDNECQDSTNTSRVGQNTNAYVLMMLNNPWYVFLRLHCLLCERLSRLKQNALQLLKENQRDSKKRQKSAAEALKLRPRSATPVAQFYQTLLQQVKNLLDGQIDGTQYEDCLRDMFTIYAYIGFTLDKIVQTMVRQLQSMFAEDGLEVMKLYEKFSAVGGTGRAAPIGGTRQTLEDMYIKAAEELMVDQNCFKTFIWHKDGKVSFELLDTDTFESNQEEEEAGRDDSDNGASANNTTEAVKKSSREKAATSSRVIAASVPVKDEELRPASAVLSRRNLDKKTQRMQHWSEYVDSYAVGLTDLPVTARNRFKEKPLLLMRNRLAVSQALSRAGVSRSVNEVPFSSLANNTDNSQPSPRPVSNLSETRKTKVTTTGGIEELSSAETESAEGENSAHAAEESPKKRRKLVASPNPNSSNRRRPSPATSLISAPLSLLPQEKSQPANVVMDVENIDEALEPSTSYDTITNARKEVGNRRPETSQGRASPTLMNSTSPSGSSSNEQDDERTIATIMEDTLTTLIDDTEVTFAQQSYKMKFIANTGLCFYRHRALSRARQCHHTVTESQNRRFLTWHQKWCLANVSMDQARLCMDWFMGRSTTAASSILFGGGLVDSVASPDTLTSVLQPSQQPSPSSSASSSIMVRVPSSQDTLTQPPYFTFYRYCIDRGERLPGSSPFAMFDNNSCFLSSRTRKFTPSTTVTSVNSNNTSSNEPVLVSVQPPPTSSSES